MGVDALMSDLERPPLLRYYIVALTRKSGGALMSDPLFCVIIYTTKCKNGG